MESALFGRFDPQHGVGRAVGQDVDQPVRSLRHITYAVVQLRQQRFAAQFAEGLAQDDPLQAAGVADLAPARAA